MTVLLDNLFVNDSGKVVLSTYSKNYTADDIKEKVFFYENLLKDKNIRNKRVGLLVPMIPSYVSLVLAINKLGGVVIPLSWQFRQDDLTAVLKFTNPHIVVTISEFNGFSFAEVINNWANELKEKTFIIEMDQQENLKEILYNGPEKSIEDSEMDFIACSSGSTGTPKGMVPRVDLFDSVYKMYPEFTELKDSDRVLTIAPPTGLGGLTLLFHGFHSGATVIYPDSFEFPNMIKLMVENNCNKLLGTPSIFRAIYQVAKQVSPQLIQNLELVGLAGERVTEDYKNQFELMENCKFVSMYGSSEAGVIGHSVLSDKVSFTLLKENQFKIKEGELLLKSPTSFEGYYKNPELTKEIVDEEGWLYTGDIVQETIDGKIEIVGRKKDMIKKGGQQVIPGEIEKILTEHAKVETAVVIGAPHNVYGEQIVAFVVTNGEVTEKEITYFCSQRIAGYKVPDHVKFIEEIPVSQGKVDKVTLKKIYKTMIEG